ncbi:hypothetical protein F2Q69_00011024 [Brassica cretica]|uniref:Uncharacterized protein n=1 Tax=Brassica cretica TaxID=69181 RepID=A0A8S9R4B2_BRACR|nr:hypothetical protein F2Q69_00011024 [Brassica cretica]
MKSKSSSVLELRFTGEGDKSVSGGKTGRKIKDMREARSKSKERRLKKYLQMVEEKQREIRSRVSGCFFFFGLWVSSPIHIGSVSLSL